LALSNNRLKGLNNWLEKKVKTLEEELIKSKNDFEKLEKHCKNSSHVCDSLVCENCENLENKVHYLVRTVDKLSKGKSYFKNVLASQNCVFGRARLGFNPQNKQDKFSKNFSKLPVKQQIVKSKQPVVTCFYCMKRGHSIRFCKIRKYYVPKGFMKWIPKGCEVSTDKNCTDPSSGVDQSQTYGGTHKGAPRRKVSVSTALGVARCGRRQVWASPGVGVARCKRLPP